MTEPLSDERLAEIRAAIKFAESYTREVVALMTDDALGLLSRLDKAEGRNRAQAVAEAPEDASPSPASSVFPLIKETAS